MKDIKLVAMIADYARGVCASMIHDVLLFLMAASHASAELVRLHSLMLGMRQSCPVPAVWLNNWSRLPTGGDLFFVTAKAPIVSFNERTTRDADVFAHLTRSSLVFAREEAVGIVLSAARVVVSGQVVLPNECLMHDFCNRTAAYVPVSIDGHVGVIDVQTLMSRSRLVYDENEEKKMT